MLETLLGIVMLVSYEYSENILSPKLTMLFPLMSLFGIMISHIC